jgi:hypothetical protein
MKKLILIIGILIGVSLSSHIQNTVKEVMDSLYSAEPITEEEENKREPQYAPYTDQKKRVTGSHKI